MEKCLDNVRVVVVGMKERKETRVDGTKQQKRLGRR